MGYMAKREHGVHGEVRMATLGIRKKRKKVVDGQVGIDRYRKRVIIRKRYRQR